MRKSRFTEEQVIGFIRRAVPIKELFCVQHSCVQLVL
jgi:hypothetical protein